MPFSNHILDSVPVCALALSFATAPLHAQRSARPTTPAARETKEDTLHTAVLEIDQSTKKGRLTLPDKTVLDVNSGQSLRLPGTRSVRVSVSNGNTALYRYSADNKSSQAPESSSQAPVSDKLGGFLKAIVAPYLPEVGLMLTGRPNGGRSRGRDVPVLHSLLPPSLPPEAPEAVGAVWSAGRVTEHAIAVVDDRLHGSTGLLEMRAMVLLSLERMRNGANADSLAALVSDSLQLERRECGKEKPNEHLPLTTDLVESLQELVQARRQLGDATLRAAGELTAESQRIIRDSLERIRAKADTATGDVESIITSAYSFERFAVPVARACRRWQGKTVNIADAEKRTLNVRIDPRDEPELARVADKSDTFTLTFESKPPPFSLSIGGSFLVAPKATYPGFDVRTATGGVEIFQRTVKDSRFTWGVTAGAGVKLTNPDVLYGLRLWLPELTFNPSGSDRIVALGTAISSGIVKLGVGALWSKHSALLGQHLGQILPNKDYFRTQDVYGKGKFYIALSLFDIPPFTYSSK